MPAQEAQVLKNPAGATSGPWYAADFGDTLTTPEWVFKRSERRRF